MHVKQRQTPAVVEFEVKIVEEPEKPDEDTAGGVAVDKTAHHQRVTASLHTCVEYRTGVDHGNSTLRF